MALKGGINMKTEPKDAGAKRNDDDRVRATPDYREAPDAPPHPSCGSTDAASLRMLRWPAVRERVGISKVTAWRWRRAGKFPEPARLGSHVIAWPEAEIDAWLAAKLAARDRKVVP